MKEPYWKRAKPRELIISHLLSCRSMKIRSTALRLLVEKREKSEKKAFAQSLYRLKQQGFIKDSNDHVTLNYKKYLQKYGTATFFEKEKSTKGVIVMFDIPEEKKDIRDWLRRQLKIWDFKMIQRSVWFGKGALTQDFRNHLKLLGIKDNVKIFSAIQNNI
jgi:DNA-binding transcriptional regulator PaaX